MFNNDEIQTDNLLTELVKKIEAGDKSAKDELIEASSMLVIGIAQKYTNRGLQFLDLIQEGNIGLMKAVDKFDHKKGIRFNAYAFWWIRANIVKALVDKGRMIRLPAHICETLNKVLRATRSLVQEMCREPTVEEIAKRADLKISAVEKAIMIGSTTESISFEPLIGEEEENHIVGDFTARNLFDEVVATETSEQVARILETLSYREEQILRRRFGIGENTLHTLKEIGRDFNVTRERIRQIEANALKKLRETLKSFYED